ncbi:MAG: SRPBCC domain-containing protein [Acidimicrobiales bacterium]
MTDPAPPADLGTLERTDDGYVVRFERRFAHPRPKVWAAITESEHLAHWLPCDIVGERAAGATVSLPFWPAHVERYQIPTPVLDGRIEVWDPPAVFEWWWSTDRLRFELEEIEGGTVLRFATWLGPVGHGAANTAAGYHACFGNLRRLLDAGTAPPLVDVDVAPLEAAYQRLAADA